MILNDTARNVLTTSAGTVTGRVPSTAPARAAFVKPAPQSNDPEITITFTVRRSHAPALRSAVEEISGEVGARLEGPHSFAKESSLTNAAIALGKLRSAVNAAVRAGDPHYA